MTTIDQARASFAADPASGKVAPKAVATLADGRAHAALPCPPAPNPGGHVHP